MLIGSKTRDMHFYIIGRLFRRARTLKKQQPINIEIGGAGVGNSLIGFASGRFFRRTRNPANFPFFTPDDANDDGQ